MIKSTWESLLNKQHTVIKAFALVQLKDTTSNGILRSMIKGSIPDAGVVCSQCTWYTYGTYNIIRSDKSSPNTIEATVTMLS